MAVSIDTVYQRVLTLANKEQRGYITPQEFNLLANQAQMEIFEQYFHDIKKQNPLPGNTEEYSDPLTVLYEKIGIFERREPEGWMILNMPVVGDSFIQIPDEIYKLGNITINVPAAQVEMLNSKDFDLARVSPLTMPSTRRPIGHKGNLGIRIHNGNGFVVPGSDQNMSISFMAKPKKVEWAYVVVNDKALYNDNIAVDFELHESEETELVYKILKLAGINLKAADVVQAGQTLEQTNKQTTL